MEEEFTLNEDEQIWYLTALAVVANADGRLDAEEINFLNEKIDQFDVSHRVRKAAKMALVEPPEIKSVCQHLRDSDARFTLFLDAMEMAFADGVLDLTEEEALDSMADALAISDEQFEALVDFFFAAHEASEAGKSASKKTKEAFREAAAGLGAVGVPLGAVAVSGSVYGLSAAGFTSGLAALGMGFGMASGLGVAVGLGIASYVGIKALFGDPE